MSPPSWQYWPDASSAPTADLIISGTLSGDIDTSPASDPAVTGLLSFQVDIGNSRITIRFTDVGGGDGGNTERAAFIAAYPDGSSVSFVCGGITYTAPSIEWSGVSNQARLASSSFDSFPASVSSDVYNFELTLAP